MKFLLKTTLRIFTLLITLLSLVATVVVAIHIIRLLLSCKVNPELCIEFVGFALLTATTGAACIAFNVEASIEQSTMEAIARLYAESVIQANSDDNKDKIDDETE